MKREEKQQRLSDFVGCYLEQLGRETDPILKHRRVTMIARSPDSPVAKAVACHVPELRAAGVRIELILAIPQPKEQAAFWLGAADLVCWAKDQRLIDAHEQLVLGASMTWCGDAMRREPGKLDMHEIYKSDCTAAAQRCMRAFCRLVAKCPAVKNGPLTASLHAVRREQPNVVPLTPDVPPQSSDPTSSGPITPVTTRH